jgi:hypothetical protein
VRIGVTGHRDVADPDDLRQTVAEVIEWLRKSLKLAEVARETPVVLQVCTPLAAGADQIVAQALFGLNLEGSGLMIPVLSDEDDYKQSIADDDPEALKYYLKQRARTRPHGEYPRRRNRVIPIGSGRADAAGFRKLGEWVVDQCDVLLALWDGQPTAPVAGASPGTAAIVSYALDHSREIPVVVVPTTRRGSARQAAAPLSAQLLLRGEPGGPLQSMWLRARNDLGGAPAGLSFDPGGYRDIRKLRVASQDARDEREADFLREVRAWPLDASGARVLNRTVIGISVRHACWANAPGLLPPQEAERDGAAVATVLGKPQMHPDVRQAAGDILVWSTPPYQRANFLAGRNQSTLRLLDLWVYLLSAVSVTLAAARATWTSRGSAAALILTCLDVVVLLAIFAFLALDVRGAARDRWTSVRAMAEYLRTYAFLALIEPDRQVPTEEDPVSLTSLELNELVGPAWFSHAMDVLWQQRPAPRQWDRAHLDSLKDIFRAWIVDQAMYHYRNARHHERAHRRYLTAVIGLFLLTLLAALVHILASGQQFDDALSFVAIAVPGFAAAVNSFAALREHHRNALRSRAAAHRLTGHHLPAISAAEDVRKLRGLARQLVHYMISEATEWYEVMAVHSVDVPT